MTMAVSFKFKGFEIERQIQCKVVDSLQQSLLPATPFANSNKNTATFLGQKIRSGISKSWVVPGQRPVRSRKNFLSNQLAQYPIPDNIRDCVYNGQDVENVVLEVAQPLHISNYKAKLSCLLHLEEMHQELEMEEFDMQAVVLRERGEYLSLQVPGLAEGRPSLLLGDRVIIYFHGLPETSPSYEGYIHEVHAADVSLKFSDDFHKSYRHEDVDVEFYFNRTPVRRCHLAVEQALNLPEQVLFPTTVQWKRALVDMNCATDKRGLLRPFNAILNDRQLTAVTRIVAGHGRPIPYVLFGPPGTGKTVTVVEAILQVFRCIKYSRILACAPSNSAADLIAERLHDSGLIKSSDMVRLNAYQRSSDVSESIFPYCTSDTDDVQRLSRRRIVVCTCSMAGFLYSLDLKAGHFTHIFVDEAGQATEPECLIPVGFAGCEDCQVILAGDPFQLGPVLRSELARHYGLDVSYLERLTKGELYQRNKQLFGDDGCYNPFVVTKLIHNYRSHASLLKLSSAVFYDNELLPCATSDVINLFADAEFLPNKQKPFIFHGVRGEDFQEGNSPSWFNPAEAVQVLKIVQTVTHIYRKVLDPSDVGIITPYRKQVEKIRALLSQVELCSIKVGSVEEFQGQERPVIIISTVRSREDKVNHDAQHNLGFLSNPKRFNVAITRAQSLLVIVGNPHVLCHDVHWCALLQYAVVNNCYYGCDLPSLHDEGVQESFRQALALVGMMQKPDEHDLQVYEKGSDSSVDNLGVRVGDFDAEHQLVPQDQDLISSLDDFPSRCIYNGCETEERSSKRANVNGEVDSGLETQSTPNMSSVHLKKTFESDKTSHLLKAISPSLDVTSCIVCEESPVRGDPTQASIVPSIGEDIRVDDSYVHASVALDSPVDCITSFDGGNDHVLDVKDAGAIVLGTSAMSKSYTLDKPALNLPSNGYAAETCNSTKATFAKSSLVSSPPMRTNALLASLVTSAKVTKGHPSHLERVGSSDST